ncbi:MAG: DUF1232 domain-containing protein [Anaerolineae bacterium]|nr:DUF1232 domain-containing protein [Anaerolineae bacterium]
MSNVRRIGMIAEIVRSLRLAWRLMNDSRVSILTRLTIPGLALVYLLFPIDVAPDLIPLLGQLDDLAVVVIALRAFIAFCPPDVVRQHEMGMDAEEHRAAPGDTSGEVIDTTFRVIEDNDK